MILHSFQSHFVINFVLTELKLTHGPVNFPVRLISHFAMNTVMAKTCSIAKVNSAKCHNFMESTKIFSHQNFRSYGIM